MFALKIEEGNKIASECVKKLKITLQTAEDVQYSAHHEYYTVIACRIPILF